MKKIDISEKQKMFCREYLKDFNGTQAAVRAGYSIKSARQQAADLLTKPNIFKFLETLKEKHVLKAELSVDSIINEFKSIGFASADGEVIKTSDKLKALEMLGKHLGMFKELSEPETEVKFICEINIIHQSKQVNFINDGSGRKL
ncbi:MAG: terminase small subunit [Ignavibacteriaceae bacterium]